MAQAAHLGLVMVFGRGLVARVVSIIGPVWLAHLRQLNQVSVVIFFREGARVLNLANLVLAFALLAHCGCEQGQVALRKVLLTLDLGQKSLRKIQ